MTKVAAGLMMGIIFLSAPVLASEGDLNALMHKAVTSYRQNNFEQSLEASKQALSYAESQKIPEIRKGGILKNMGMAQMELNQFEEARENFETAKNIYDRAFGPANPLSAGIVAQMGLLFRKQGKMEEAMKFEEQAFLLRDADQLQRQNSAAFYTGNLAMVHHAEGEYEAAEPLYLSSLDLRKLIFGETHPSVFEMTFALAQLYEHTGQVSLAEASYRETLNKVGAVTELSFERKAVILNRIADFYVKQNQLDRADAIRQQAREMTAEPSSL